jgi:osomolarity two-component system, sensor histidine kinase NIK1
MARNDETLAAAATVLRTLAREPPASPRSLSESSQISAMFENELDMTYYKLPGPATPAKEAFEAELVALARRIQYLESRAEVGRSSPPDTPGDESQLPVSQLSKTPNAQVPVSDPSCLSANGRSAWQTSVSTRSKRVSHLLAARDIRNGAQHASRTVSEDDISYLREHIEKQAEEIKSQRETIADISRGLRRSEEEAKLAFMRVENDDVGLLERELRKHQQANEAFQRALREIGGIITQVANGDLSKRVQIQATEMDAEIAAFKVTINTMMDQLEVFGSEVSRVAREVGTEGILGGQAQISGVHGIWKELTENGMQIHCSSRILGLTKI